MVLYTSKSVYIELQHYATSTTLIQSVFLFFFLKGAEQVKKKKRQGDKNTIREVDIFCATAAEKKKKRRRLLISVLTAANFAVVAFVSPSSHDKIAQRGI